MKGFLKNKVQVIITSVLAVILLTLSIVGGITISSLNNQVNDLNKKIKNMNKVDEELDSYIDNLETELNEISTLIEELSSKDIAIEGKISSLENIINNLNTTLESLTIQINQNTEYTKVLENIIAGLEIRVNCLEENHQFIYDDSNPDMHNVSCEHCDYEQIGLHTKDENGVCSKCHLIMENATYEIPEGENYAIFSKYTGSATKVRIPSVYNRLTVTQIGDSAFSDNSKIIDIKMPDSIVEIGYNAFLRCKSLVDIKLSKNLKVINGGAFDGCISLTEIELPYGLETIGHGVFFECVSLKSIDIPDSVTIISGNAFYRCTSLKEVELSNGLTQISMLMFANCTSLTSIKLPDSVINIEPSAFENCMSLTNITMNNVKKVGYQAFSGCAFTEINMPSVTSIGGSAFIGNNKLTKIILGSPLEQAGTNIFKSLYNDSGYTSQIDLVMANGQKNFTGDNEKGWIISDEDIPTGDKVKFLGYTFKSITITE